MSRKGLCNLSCEQWGPEEMLSLETMVIVLAPKGTAIHVAIPVEPPRPRARVASPRSWDVAAGTGVLRSRGCLQRAEGRKCGVN